MSAHLMIVAGYMDLPLSHKMVLMKVCDSADDRNRLGFPGLDAIRLWSGLKKSRALGVLKELQDMGLIMQVEAGHRGRRAVYKAFPDAGDEAYSLAHKQKKECPGAALFKGSPGIPSDDELNERVAAMDASTGAMAGSAAPVMGPTDRTQSNGSDRLDPNPSEAGERVQRGDGKGPISGANGSDTLDPFGSILRELHLPTTSPSLRSEGADDETPALDLVMADARPAPAEPTFDEFYERYPKAADRAVAERTWHKWVGKGVKPAVIMAGLEQLLADPNLPGPAEKRYIKNAATWLNAKGWNHEPLAPRVAGRVVRETYDDVKTWGTEEERLAHAAAQASLSEAEMDALIEEQYVDDGRRRPRAALNW